MRDPGGVPKPSVSLRLSVVIPAHNAEGTLGHCLDALQASQYPPLEVIVVEDRSTDGTADLALRRGALVAPSPGIGPAAARNHGARIAHGDIVVFIDADVAVRPETLGRVAQLFTDDPGMDAVFGSYDDAPAALNFLSQYKNLQHHFVHQSSPGDAMTFWAGCGAIRGDAFHAVGGFCASRFPHASVEDIELGLRLWRQGHRVLLAPELQVKHLKRWGVRSLLHAEVFRRAVPWSKLILESGVLPDRLNVGRQSRICAALVLAGLGLMPLHWPSGLALLLAAAVLDRGFYLFLARKRGVWFALRGLVWHQLYYLYSSAAFACCWASRFVGRPRLSPQGS
jgi:glycosyltransferase involved in cell wall biosynthesis